MPNRILTELTEVENTVFIILFPDGNGGYLPNGEVYPEKDEVLDVWVEKNSRKNKIRYVLVAKVPAGYKKLNKEKYELIIDFKAPESAQVNQRCPNPVKWGDGQNRQRLKVKKHFIIVRKSKHKDNACYNYDISVDTKSGQAPIEIDPWLRIRHR